MPCMKFKKDDPVRISKLRGVFDKKYEQSFTDEVFKVTESIPRTPPVYKLQDYDEPATPSVSWEPRRLYISSEHFGSLSVCQKDHRVSPAVRLGHAMRPCREPTPSTPSHASRSKPSPSPPIPGSAIRITSFWDPYLNTWCWAWCITEAFTGKRNLSPFNFIHNDVEYLALCQDGRQVPAKAFQPQFGQGISVREFYNMFIATGRHLKDLPLSINRKEFNEGYSLFVFNLEAVRRQRCSVPRLHRKFKTRDEIQAAPPPHHHTRGVRLLLFDSWRSEFKEASAGGLLLNERTK
ncbi:hypothetical protein L3Q82_015360 [Scortum barcoo]|uniref:Uncharacterized protein n=1 Tax=Scortum barcoo TaxID=214431 RepID=A0ACB8VUV5_9TELE|nr:hypothetical protein L3Q82_015360 [Scortum barcoo]